MALVERPNLDALRILCYPDKRLRHHAVPLEQLDSFLDEMSDRMNHLMRDQGGIGLAATQVGWPFRLIVINPAQDEAKEQAFINPVIIERDGRVVEEEGCLSVPGIRAKVKRADFVRVRALTLNGEELELEAEGLLARLFQHELDHLDGRLFVDCVGPAARVIVKRRLKELARRHNLL